MQGLYQSDGIKGRFNTVILKRHAAVSIFKNPICFDRRAFLIQEHMAAVPVSSLPLICLKDKEEEEVKRGMR